MIIDPENASRIEKEEQKYREDIIKAKLSEFKWNPTEKEFGTAKLPVIGKIFPSMVKLQELQDEIANEPNDQILGSLLRKKYGK